MYVKDAVMDVLNSVSPSEIQLCVNGSKGLLTGSVEVERVEHWRESELQDAEIVIRNYDCGWVITLRRRQVVRVEIVDNSVTLFVSL